MYEVEFLHFMATIIRLSVVSLVSLGDYSKNIAHKKSRAPCIAPAALRSQSRVAFAKSKDPTHIDTIEGDCKMDTSKVIELGKVSEETKGHGGHLEGGIDPNSGPGLG